MRDASRCGLTAGQDAEALEMHGPQLFAKFRSSNFTLHQTLQVCTQLQDPANSMHKQCLSFSTFRLSRQGYKFSGTGEIIYISMLSDSSIETIRRLFCCISMFFTRASDSPVIQSNSLIL